MTTYANGDTFENGVLTIKEGTVRVEAGAYKDRNDIVEVRFPDTLVAIDKWAFGHCSNITTLHLSAGTVAEIGAGAFSGCSGITTLHLPDTLTKISGWAFDGCSSITTLHLSDTLAAIGWGAFGGCSGITALHMPDALAKIGDFAFACCSGITTLHLPDALNKIGEDAFNDCINLETVLASKELVEMIKDEPGFKDLVGKIFSPKLLRLDYWHETMHQVWTSSHGKEAVIAFLLCEKRIDEEEIFVSLDHELWLLILTFIRRDQLGN